MDFFGDGQPGNGMRIAKDIRTDIGREKAMVITSLDVLEGRVNRGAQLLDLARPGWATLIDVDHIESACPIHSVTGQLFGPDIDEQFAAVGVHPVTDEPWAGATAFAENGFAVLMADVVKVPDGIRNRLTALVAELSATVGKDMSEIMKVPAAIPYPRDQDVVSQEAFTIDLLWRKAVRSRL